MPILVMIGILSYRFMNNLPFHNCGPTPIAVGKYLYLTILGYLGASVGIVLLIVPRGGFPTLIKTFLVVAVAVTLAAMRYLTPRETKENLLEQWGIFRDKHN